MNYRHAFHAGNFADLVKHALLLWLLRETAAASSEALTVVDTHAGSGLYDLTAEGARSREAEAGIARLMQAARPPGPLADLKAIVSERNGGSSSIRWYPGSPVLIADALRPGDRYAASELRPAENDLLAARIGGRPGVETRCEDGYDAAIRWAREGGPKLFLIDPPFERPDDYARCAETAGAILKADPGATLAIWTPLKDMETFDGFLRRLGRAGVGRALVAEARLRPLDNPMKMNGCAVVMVNAPKGAQIVAQDVCDWVARGLGESGGRGEAWWTDA